MSLSVRICRVDEIFDADLSEGHYKEVPNANGLPEIDLDKEQYRALEKAGVLICTAVFDSLENMVGYLTTLLYNPLHFKGRHFAMMDTIYIIPRYRRLGAGKVLLKFTERYVGNVLNIEVFHLVSNSLKPIDIFAEENGYKESDVIYVKNLW